VVASYLIVVLVRARALGLWILLFLTAVSLQVYNLNSPTRMQELMRVLVESPDERQCRPLLSSLHRDITTVTGLK
jgi:hypothetical protein